MKMKKKFALWLFTALLFPIIATSCDKEEEQKTVQPAADLVIDNCAVTLLQGDEITVSITSGNGDYSVKTFDESVATATIDGDKVTIKATENSVLNENNRTETTILVIDGRKKTARIKVQVAKLWDLTTDIPEEGIELFIGEKKTIEILTGNGDYKITMPEGAEQYIKLDELSGQVFSVTALEETPQGEPVQITITDKKQKTIAILIIVNIVDLTLKSNEATFAEPDAEVQTIEIEKGNGGYKFTFRTDEGEPTATPTIVEATEEDNFITLKPLARGDVTVIVTDQKGSKEEIAVKVNPYEIKLDGNLTELSLDGFESTKKINISRGNGGYQLAELTADNLKYIKSASINGENLTIEAKWMGETTLTITDDAGKTLELPVKINSMAAKLSSDYCFKIGSKDFFNQSPYNNMQQLTFEMVFYPTYSRALQSFIGLEGVFLLRCENNGDTDLKFEIATKIDGKSDPRFRSQQRMGNDRQNNGQWYHIAIVYDGTKNSTKDAYQMYINGVKEELTPAEDSYADVAPNTYLNLSEVRGDEALMIGRSGNSEFRLGYCNVAQARMWKIARTEKQIKEDMCKYYTPEEARANENLLGYWIPGNGIETGTFKNYGFAGEVLDAKVYTQGTNITETKIKAEQFASTACPHTY